MCPGIAGSPYAQASFRAWLVQDKESLNSSGLGLHPEPRVRLEGWHAIETTPAHTYPGDMNPTNLLAYLLTYLLTYLKNK